MDVGYQNPSGNFSLRAAALIIHDGKLLLAKSDDCNGVQREHNKKLNNGLPILHKVPPK